MKSTKFFVLFFLFVVVFSLQTTNAQNGPVLYLCEEYGDYGEVGISDRFTTGFVTVMVKCDYALGLEDVAIQYDKYNPVTGQFEYYKKFYFTISSSMKYVYFSKNSSSDMSFDEPGFYRVYLLDENDDTVTSSLVEIIRR